MRAPDFQLAQPPPCSTVEWHLPVMGMIYRLAGILLLMPRIHPVIKHAFVINKFNNTHMYVLFHHSNPTRVV